MPTIGRLVGPGDFMSIRNENNLSPSQVSGLSLLIPGLGQLYNGQFRKGLIFQLVAFTSYILFALMIFVSSITALLVKVSSDSKLKVNEELASVFGALHESGLSPFFLVFSLIILGFVAFSARDAFQTAVKTRKKPIYRDFYIEMSEACGSSYLAHVFAILACFVLAFFVLVPAPPKQVVTEFVFYDTPEEEAVKPPVVHNHVTSHNRIASATADQSRSPALAKLTAQTPAQAQSKSQSKSQAQAQSRGPVPNLVPVHRNSLLIPVPQPTAVQPRNMVLASALPSLTPQAKSAVSAPMSTASMSSKPMSLVPVPTAVAAAQNLPSPLPLKAMTGFAVVEPVMPRAVSGQAARFGTAGGAAAPQPVSISPTSGFEPSPVAVGTAADPSGSGSYSGPAPSPVRNTASNAGRSGISGLSGKGPVVTAVVRPAAGSGARGGQDDHTASEEGKGKSPVTSAREPDFSLYMSRLQSLIKKRWFPPRHPMANHVKAVFDVSRDGTMSGLRLVRSSGITIIDRAALEAINSAAPFPPLPEYSPPSVTIEFSFDYNVFSKSGVNP